MVEETLKLFGVERCMLASNFPVDGLCASYAQIYAGFFELTAGLDESDQRRLFHDNAVACYRLD